VVPALVAHHPALAPITYQSSQFACARFHQSVQTSVRVESGNRGVRQASGREGTLILLARDSAGSLRLESWFDSLMVWREEATGKTSPSTDGVIGGRFIGLLSSRGRYLRIDAPFVPGEIAEITDLSATLDDLLPPLPDQDLAVGQRWQDSSGWALTRLSDQKALQRYRVSGAREGTEHLVFPDSTAVEAKRAERETGLLLWDPARGLARWDRSIEADADVPQGGDIPRGARTHVEQTIRLERVTGPMGGNCGS
jgi:hypothetical protein